MARGSRHPLTRARGRRLRERDLRGRRRRRAPLRGPGRVAVLRRVSGFSRHRRRRRFRGEYRRAVQNCALQPIAQELEGAAAKTDELHAAVAVRVSDRSLLVEWRGAESAEEASERLVEEASLILDINASRASLAEGVAGATAGPRGAAIPTKRSFWCAEDAARLRTFRISDDEVRDTFHIIIPWRLPDGYREGELPTFVLNLASSFGRRQHVRSQLQRASLLDQARWISGVDGSLLSPRVTRATLREGSVLSQGEVGIWLSHLTAWHDIVEGGCPLRLVLEDDVVLSADIKAVFEERVDRSGWGGLGLGSAGCWYARAHACRRRNHATIHLRKMY